MRRTPDAIGDSQMPAFVEPLDELYVSLKYALLHALGDDGRTAAWRREPSRELIGEVHRQWYRRRALASGEDEHVPLHLALSETHSGNEAVAYQRNIERHPRCVASFGTLAETAVERDRAWSAIAQRGVARKGSFTFRAAARLVLPDEALTELLEQWTREDRVEPNAFAAWAREEAFKNRSECRVTTRGDDHHVVREQLRRLYPMDPDTYGWPTGVKESKPKTTVIQRRIVMGLAHELTDADRETVVREWCEENLRGTSWHACILAPDTWEQPGHVVARVAYTQFELERVRDWAGETTNRWTFERGGTLPSPSSIVSALWGNSPEGRKGRDALLRDWRYSLASIQNRHLCDAGSRRRYDPRSYRDRGSPTGWAEETPTVPGRDRANQADAGWSTIESLILQMGGVGASGHKGEGLEFNQAAGMLRLYTGMRAEEAARTETMPDFWKRLDSFEERAEPTSEESAAVIWWLRALQRAFCPCRPAEPWLERWRNVWRDEPDEIMVGVAAASLVQQWTDREKARYEYDPRPEVRALLCAARGWMARIERWRKQLPKDGTESPASGALSEIEGFVDLLEHRGIDLRQIGRTEDGKWLMGVAAQCKVRATIGEVVSAIRGCTDEESIRQVTSDWYAHNEVGLQAMRDAGLPHPGEITTACDATTMRNLWRALAQGHGTEEVVAYARQFKRGSFFSGPINVFREQWNAMERLDQMDVELRADGRSEDAETLRTAREHAGRYVKQMLDSSEEGLGNPGALDEVLANKKFLGEIQRYEPRLAERVRAASARVAARRKRVSEAGRAVAVTATEPDERARQAALVTPTQAASWAGVDIDILQYDEPRVWKALQVLLRKFATVVRRRITRRANAASNATANAWWEDLVSPEELNVLEVIAPELSLEVKGLHETVQRRKEVFLRKLERMAEQIEIGDETRRRRRQEKLARELATEQALAVLTRADWMQLARTGRLGAKGDWRATADP